MKSKKAQRILLISVLVVWGLIFYRIFIYMKKDDSPKLNQKLKTKQAINKVSLDSLKLLANYPDPFQLSKIKIVQHNKKSIPKSIKIESPKNEIILPLPKINYKGLIYNKLKNRHVGIIVLNQNSQFINEGDSIQNWLIHKIYKDSLVLTHSKQRVCINLSK